MKKNRILKIKETNGLCENCGLKGAHVHHKDFGKTDHSLKNLQFLCVSCHGLMHVGRKNKRNPKPYSCFENSDFYKKYGISCKELSKFCGHRVQDIYYWDKKGKMDKFLIKSV